MESLLQKLNLMTFRYCYYRIYSALTFTDNIFKQRTKLESKRCLMNIRPIVTKLLALALLCCPLANAAAQTTLSPTDHCQNFTQDAIVTFADVDLAEVVNEALGLAPGAALRCGQAAMLERLVVGTTIERVVYGGTLRPSPEKPFESLEGIQNLTGLTRLNLLNRLITDISPLRSMTNLVNLNLHTNWFSDLSPLSDLINLEQLIISENPIFDISPLEGLTKLRQLHVHGLYPHQLKHYLDMNDGRDPNVVFNGITDISALADLTEMRLLRIHLNAISDISPLANLTKLTHLRIYNSEIKDISALGDLDDLVLLWAHNNQIENISALSGNSGMQQLSLNNNAISDVSALSDMIDMEHLFLSNNDIADISPLRRLHALKVLRLENNNITDVSALAGLSELNELSLAQNFSLNNVQALLLNSGLGESDELDLRFTAVRCSDMAAFSNLGVNLLRVTAINGSSCPGRRLEDP